MTTRGGWASDGEEGTNYQGTTRSRATTGFNGVPTSTRDQPEVPAKLQPHQTQGRTTGPLLIKGEEAQQPSSSCLGRVWSYLCVLDRFAKIDLRTTIDTRREKRRYTVEGTLTSLTVLALAVLAALRLYWLRQEDPFVKTASNEWSIYQPPFPMTVTCHASSGGCYVSNFYSGFSLDSTHCKQAVPTAQQACVRLSPGETRVVGICYSTLSTDGVSIFTPKAGLADWAHASRFKASVTSETGNPATGATALLQSPVPPGSTVLQYVQTENNTKAPADSGFFRREYFPTILSYDGTIQVNTSHCHSLNSTAYDQTRLTLAPAWFRVVVTHKTFLESFGSFGGIYHILMNAGATLLALYWTVQGLIRSSMARGKGVAPDQGDGPPEGGLAKTVNAATMPVLAATYVDEVQYMAATGWH